ncbi:Transcriptional regulator, contains XRE-family HTH domain [Pseudarcicella hirudinis]|uniref:Transcriptional regulator, contains XRE-family HTH domain n=1 Tax=Pseudarcicella hirudinis TaxID=1079859 RepID=A0A1I5M3H9_9BACT|nr:helix-turn-helix domain-containing protein [Pseudarcicella hirudinis]SFP04164.1 Transcriptional regulator, contains XRE-family HTH domain [Pseudarcicella hirudinis]
MNTKLGLNLQNLRKRYPGNPSQGEIAEKLGLAKSTYGSYEQGRTEPKVEDIVKLADFFGVSTDDLLTKDLATYIAPPPAKKTDNLRILATTVDSDDNENIEFVPIKAVAGYTDSYHDSEFISKLPVFQVPFLPQDKKYRVFPIQGDSMLPLQEGSLVFAEYVDDWYHIRNGTICIVVTKDEGIVLKKVFNYLNEKNVFVLKSTNERYAPYPVLGEDIAEVWKFVGYFHKDFPQ